MKKKFKNFDCASSYSIYVRIMEILVFIFLYNSALLKTFRFDSYLHWKSTKVKALQLFNACQEDKHGRRQNTVVLSYEKSWNKLDLLSFFNSPVLINL